jgi:hypothetical protein
MITVAVMLQVLLVRVQFEFFGILSVLTEVSCGLP